MENLYYANINQKKGKVDILRTADINQRKENYQRLENNIT